MGEAWAELPTLLLPHFGILAVIHAVAALARRRPRRTRLAVALVVGVAAAALAYAKWQGIRYDPVSREVVYGSAAGPLCLAAGVLGVGFGLPTLLLAAEAGQRAAVGWREWAGWVFGCWFLGCAGGTVLFVALGGHSR